jgi:hypothetical protein
MPKKQHPFQRINYATLIAITMAKKHSKESQQKALKCEAYQLNISLSELKRLKSAGDGEDRNSPLPHPGDIIVSHESYETVSLQDAPQEVVPGCMPREAASQEAASEAASPVIAVVPGVHKATSRGTASPEAALREALLQDATSREAPPVITVMSGAHEATSRRDRDALREAASQEAKSPVITVVPGAHKATSRGAASPEGVLQEALLLEASLREASPVLTVVS